MIGSLLYLTASRPDILFIVCLCARFHSDPRESHLTDVKRIFRYLKGTKNLGLLYRKYLDISWLDFVMLTMLMTWLKENQQMETASSWERIGYLGLAKDMQLLLCLQQKQNTSQLQVVVHNYFGWNISWKIIRLMLTVFLSFVIIVTP